MQIKLIEIRDKMTFIPAAIIKTTAETPEEQYLLMRSTQISSYGVYLFALERNVICTDPFDWGHSRTYAETHRYCIKNFDEIVSGDVIDVEYILGESTTKKKSERIEIQDMMEI